MSSGFGAVSQIVANPYVPQPPFLLSAKNYWLRTACSSDYLVLRANQAPLNEQQEYCKEQ